MPFNRLLKLGEKSKRTDLSQEETPPGSADSSIRSPVDAVEETTSLPENPIGNETAGVFYEKDNQAVRIHRLSQANDIWSEYEKWRPTVPFLRYVFDTELQAVEALLSVSCIHQAEDTGHLVCTEPITMGCHRAMDGRYEVFLAGEKLSFQIWSEATEKFSSRCGQYRNQLRPETYERFKSHSQADEVVLQKEYYEITPTETKYYQIFEASSFTAAKNFLMRNENVITCRSHFIHVITPKGTFIRDIDGIHE